MTRPIKRSFTINGHRTSISIEEPFWEALRDAAEQEETSVAALVARIDAGRKGGGLSSAVRVWLLRRATKAPAERGAGGGDTPES